MKKLNRIDQELDQVRTVAIAGHVRPDGDSIGSCLGIYWYLRDNYPELECIDVYLEEIPEKFQILEGYNNIKHSFEEEKQYDLFFAVDCADCGRLGESDKYFHIAKKTICYDHHISNKGFADKDYIEPDMSSASELVFHAMDPEKITLHTAEALYMGMVHDTGIFQYSCTSPETMEAAAFLMRKGVRYTEIIDRTYMEKTHLQKQLLAKAILESRLFFCGKCLISTFTKGELAFFGAKHSDLNGIVSELRQTEGVEVSALIEEVDDNDYRISMRSRSYVDVSRIASLFGGGGHVRAAGCSMKGTQEEVVRSISCEIEKQII